MTTPTDPLLSVNGLSVEFETSTDPVRVIDGVSFDLFPGEMLGLVGESGSGKSLLAMAVMGLIRPPGRVVSGSVVFDGRDLTSMTEKQLSEIRGRRVAIIPQDAALALTPVLTIADQIGEVLRRHVTRDRSQIAQISRDTLARVGLADPERVLRGYPSSLSCGMKQRVAIAMALCTGPELLIADDPTSAVDVTIQAQILNDLHQLTTKMGVSMIFISHDLRVISSLCSRVATLYAGQIAEISPTNELLHNAHHPYSLALVECTPSVEQRVNPLPVIHGSPVGSARANGCRFHPRCPRVLDICRTESPSLPNRLHGCACFNPVSHDEG